MVESYSGLQKMISDLQKNINTVATHRCDKQEKEMEIFSGEESLSDDDLSRW